MVVISTWTVYRHDHNGRWKNETHYCVILDISNNRLRTDLPKRLPTTLSAELVMILGFTGTRFGMTFPQSHALHEVVLSPVCYYATRHLNGGCHGADREMFEIVLELIPGVMMEILPGNPEQVRWAEQQRINPALNGRYLVHKMEPYLVRDLKIATRCTRLVACPCTVAEQARSGTWATVRYARKAGKPITLVLPDGRVVEELGGLL